MTKNREQKRIVFRGGTRINLLREKTEKFDILLERGAVLFLPPGSSIPNAEEISVDGKMVVPGFVDLHTHLRSPGSGKDETLESGLMSALQGGVTSLCCMGNTSPANDSPKVTRWILERCDEIGGPRVFPVSAVTKGLQGKELVDFQGQKEAGARAFSDDGRPLTSDSLMREALQRAAELDLPLISHCEDPSFSRGGAMAEGSISSRMGVKSMARGFEQSMVERDIGLAADLNVSVHIAHVSTGGAVEAIRKAKDKGVQVTAETTPHHLCLTEEDCIGLNPDFKMNPPLGSREDRAALLEGIKDGTIDVIATDHAPHRQAFKSRGFVSAPFGVVGMESLFPILFTILVEKGLLSLEELLEKISLGPSKILRLSPSELEEMGGKDFAVLDLKSTWMICKNRLFSMGKNCPFHGFVVRGRPLFTVVGGRVHKRMD